LKSLTAAFTCENFTCENYKNFTCENL